MGRIFVLIFFIIVSFLTYSQDETKAPYSSEYQHYLENPDLYKKGYIPHPLRVNYSKITTKSTTILPASYDLRDVNGKNYVTPVKNQGSYGTCWAFAASASIESYWLTLGLPETALSVRNFANCHGFEWGPSVGGNAFLASAYLTRLSAPVYEWADPYSNMNETGCKTFNSDSVIPAHVSHFYKASGAETIKKLLIKYGALATSMSTQDFNTHYNSSTRAYYYNGNQPVDHGVTIVGWDDDFVVSGIPSGNPSGKGAWIVKNSWGFWWGENGYFYVSYYDKHLGKEVSLYPGRIEKQQTDTLYLFDRLGAVSSHGIKDSENREVAYALVKHNSPDNQIINRIGTYVNTGGTRLGIVVAREWDGSILRDTIEEQQNLICRFPGYHSFEFSSPIETGDFYVMIRYETPGYSWPIPIETVSEGFSNPRIEDIGHQWISEDGTNWVNVGISSENDFDLCVRAYAKNSETPVAIIKSSRPYYCIGSTVEVENNSSGVADSFKWVIFNKDTVFDTLTSYSVSTPLQYNISQSGFVDVKLIAYHALKNDTLIRYQLFEMVNEPEIFMLNQSPQNTVARYKPVTIVAYGADQYIWPATSNYPESYGEMITFDIKSPEVLIKVKGILGTCEAWDSILIKSVEVPYDDIKDARLLTINETEGPFSNAYATVEPLEPAPEEGDCNNQINWCTEGGLHNTLWFKFKAPVTEEVRIISWGFDNQLALYDAKETGTWQDIMSGDTSKYTLIAANDDAHESDYSAEINTVYGLTPGKTYWIQMDGSAGGDIGEATIKVETGLPSIVDFPVNVYPSIVVDTLRFDLKGMDKNGAVLKIYSIAGQLVINETIDWSMLSDDISDSLYFGQWYINRFNLSPGLYILELKGSNFHYTNKIQIKP